MSKKQFNTRIDNGLHDRAIATVRGIKRLDPDYTLSQFAGDAIAAWCAHLEATYNTGEPWPVEPEALRPGRPFGA
jgi:hypothetical protein